MGEKEWTCGNVIKIVKNLYQGDPFYPYPLGFVGEDVLVKPVKKKVHMLLIFVGLRRACPEVLLDKRDESFKGGPITFESN
ncbi:hypothetical protein ACFX2A_029250 [Malus domestica]